MIIGTWVYGLSVAGNLESQIQIKLMLEMADFFRPTTGTLHWSLEVQM
jgi:hypothetical protein